MVKIIILSVIFFVAANSTGPPDAVPCDSLDSAGPTCAEIVAVLEIQNNREW